MKDHGRAQETVVIGAMRPLVIGLRSVLLELDAGLVQRWRLRCGEVDLCSAARRAATRSCRIATIAMLTRLRTAQASALAFFAQEHS